MKTQAKRYKLFARFRFPMANTRTHKPRGRNIFIEFRGEHRVAPTKPLHKKTEAQVKKEMAVLPLEWMETIGVLPRQHIIVFRKTNAPSSPKTPSAR